MIKGGVTYRIVTDNVGSIRLVVNVSSGAVAQRIDYDEFGRVTQNTSPGFQPFGFAGGLYDEDTKLVRFGARDYDPETGRWIAKDPIYFDAGSSNLYAYALEDPINLVDTDGLQAMAPPIGGNPFFPPLTFPPAPRIDLYEDYDWTGGWRDLWEDFIDGPIPIDDFLAWCADKARDAADNIKEHRKGKRRSTREKHEDRRLPHKDKKRAHDTWQGNPNRSGNVPKPPEAPKPPMPNKGPKKP